MAGMIGYEHRCESQLTEKSLCKKSIHESKFSTEQISIIWDFYVVKSFAASTGQSVSLDEYGWKSTTSNVDGMNALEKELAEVAGIESFCIIRSNKIKDTLTAMGLSNSMICVEHPRAVMHQNYSYEIDEDENAKMKSSESRVNAIFRHIRNSMAHGLTYFFDDNNTILFEDKDGNKQTASILLKQDTLIEWIKVVDKNSKYYKFL